MVVVRSEGAAEIARLITFNLCLIIVGLHGEKPSKELEFFKVGVHGKSCCSNWSSFMGLDNADA